MAFKVNANVVDIKRDSPRSSDVLLVDSNVWYWLGYTNATINAQPYQTQEYPAYIGNALLAQSRLYACTLSFAELAHAIEGSERSIFNDAQSKNGLPKVPAKQFRQHYSKERSNIVAEIESAWQLAMQSTNGLTLEVDVTTALVDDCLDRIKTQAVDGYDAFMIEAMLAAGISHIITDDADYGQVPNITVLTANNFLISEARTQRKLLRR